MLETGSLAPGVLLKDTDGHAVRLSALDAGAALVYFMRSTSCPVCNRHVQDLVRSRAEFAAADVQVLIAVPEGREAAAAWKAKRDIPFSVLVGRDGAPHASVGLSRKVFGSMQQSGSVLVDAHGIVRHAHGSTMPTGAYDKKGIAAAVRGLRTLV
ncbi:peroxiredoxin family protein [Actinomadura harenae]|uniref:Peroxiredoxin n=1 Tax=Actinomadura harenae TaxID=2483351 RepID=A0A3M2MEK6_9ACTN|nr:redoxin domain-containing protein [Actinomadura harenae]RMI47440.1 peroxiredoxin [Actinomadura harenae]